MIFDWWKLFNRTEWLELELVDRTLDVFLEDLGFVSIVITQGMTTAITFDGVFLPLEFADKNPFIGLGNIYSVYVDANDDVYLGKVVEE